MSTPALEEAGHAGRRWLVAFQVVDFAFIPVYALLLSAAI